MNKANQSGSTHSFSLKDYRQTVFKMSGILRKLRDFSEKLNLKQSVQLTNDILQRVEENSFSLAVVGEFNRGKSTFINALLGQDILPSDILPTTATVNRVNYGIKPFVKILFKNNTDVVVTIDQLKDYVTKLTPESESEAACVQEAIIYYPIHYCQNNISIIDTPGLSEDEAMTNVTLSVLPHVDVAILLVMAQSPLSQSEKIFLENHLLTQDLGRIIFVVNGIDLCHQSEDAEKVVNSVEDRIKKQVLKGAEDRFGKDSEEYKAYLSRIGKPKVFGVSARQALQAKKNGDADLLNKSRFSELEIALERFLSQERGLIFLQVPTNRTITLATEILTAIKIEEQRLEKQQSEIKLIYENVITAIENNQQRKQQNQSSIESFRQKSQQFLNQLYPEFSQGVSHLIDNTSLTAEHLSQSTMLKSMLQIDRQVVQFLESYSRQVANKLKRNLQPEIVNLEENMQIASDQLEQLFNNVEKKCVSWVKMTSKSIIDNTVAWKVACTLKRDGGGLNPTRFKRSYQGSLSKEITKQFNLYPIHQQIYDDIKEILERLDSFAKSQEQSELPKNQTTTIDCRRQLEQEETLINFKRQELSEMWIQTQQILEDAQALCGDIMQMMDIKE